MRKTAARLTFDNCALCTLHAASCFAHTRTPKNRSCTQPWPNKRMRMFTSLPSKHIHTQSIKICLARDCSVDNDLSLGTVRGQTRLTTDWRLLCGLPISNSMTFRGKKKAEMRFFYLEGVRLTHCSALVQFPCGKHTVVPRLDMVLHTPSLHPSLGVPTLPCLGRCISTHTHTHTPPSAYKHGFMKFLLFTMVWDVRKQGLQLEKWEWNPLGQGHCVRAWEGTHDEAWKLPTCLGQRPSFKWVTTVYKQTTNLVSSLFTAARLSPGRLINIRDLPKKPFSEEGWGWAGEGFARRKGRGGRHVRQMGTLIDEKVLVRVKLPPTAHIPPTNTQTDMQIPQNSTDTPQTSCLCTYECVFRLMGLGYISHLVWQQFSDDIVVVQGFFLSFL